jgi:hypothetical protein
MPPNPQPTPGRSTAAKSARRTPARGAGRPAPKGARRIQAGRPRPPSLGSVVTRTNLMVAAIMAVLFIVMGGIAVIRSGLGLLSPHVRVGPFHHTVFLGGAEQVYGLLWLGVALTGGGRIFTVMVSALGVGAGLVTAAGAGALHGFLGVHVANAALYILSGALGLFSALVLEPGARASARGRPPPARTGSKRASPARGAAPGRTRRAR